MTMVAFFSSQEGILAECDKKHGDTCPIGPLFLDLSCKMDDTGERNSSDFWTMQDLQVDVEGALRGSSHQRISAKKHYNVTKCMFPQNRMRNTSRKLSDFTLL